MELTDPLLQERFRVLEVLEESAAGRRWRAVERSSGRQGILETVLAGSPAKEDVSAVARSLVGSASAHVAEVWQLGLNAHGMPFLFRQDPVGVTLKDALAAGGISQATAIEVACQCLKGLEFLHQRSIWVQNLSPKDIVLSHSNGRLEVKIVDTGVFRSWGEAPGATAASSVFVGRLKYAAPEQFEESQPFGAPAGTYVLGLILYEMLTGQFPIKGESASSLIAGHLFRPPLSFDETDPEGRLSPELRGVLASMLAKSPEDRFQTANEALSFLRPLDAGESPLDGGKGAILRELIEAAQQAEQAAASSTAVKDTETVRLSPEKIQQMREMAAAASGAANGPTAMIRQVRDQVQEEDVRRRAALEEKAREKARETGLKVEELLRRARSSAQLEQFQEALSLVREALSLSPDHAEALMLRASLDACLRIQEEEELERQGLGIHATGGQTSTQEATGKPPLGPSVDLPPIPAPGTTSRSMDAKGTVEPTADASEARTMRIPERDLEVARSGLMPAVSQAQNKSPESAVTEPEEDEEDEEERHSTGAIPDPASISLVEPIGSVTLPMATIEEAKRRAAELQAQRSSGPPATGSAPPPPPSVTRVDTDAVVDLASGKPSEPPAKRDSPTKVEAFGSVTLPMAAIQEAKRRHLEQQHPSQGHRPHEPSKGNDDAPGSVDAGPKDSTLPPMPVRPHRPSSGGLEVEPYGGAEVSTGSVAPETLTPQPVAPQQQVASQPAAADRGSFVDDRPAIDRTLSDLGFGGAEEDSTLEPPLAGMYPPQKARRGGPPDGRWVKPMAMVGLVAALALVFGLSFFLSGRLTDGGAGSSPILALPAEDVQGTNLPPGWLALDASPWGEIQSVASSSGESIPVIGPPYTPKLLELPPGQYSLTLTHPARDQPVQVTVEVETGKTTRHLVSMEIDLDELLARSGW